LPHVNDGAISVRQILPSAFSDAPLFYVVARGTTTTTYTYLPISNMDSLLRAIPDPTKRSLLQNKPPRLPHDLYRRDSLYEMEFLLQHVWVTLPAHPGALPGGTATFQAKVLVMPSFEAYCTQQRAPELFAQRCIRCGGNDMLGDMLKCCARDSQSAAPCPNRAHVQCNIDDLDYQNAEITTVGRSLSWSCKKCLHAASPDLSSEFWAVFQAHRCGLIRKNSGGRYVPGRIVLSSLFSGREIYQSLRQPVSANVDLHVDAESPVFEELTYAAAVRGHQLFLYYNEL
jgi:hypothetical protein